MYAIRSYYAFDDVAQLPDVAVPVIPGENVNHFRRELHTRFAHLAAERA